MQGEVPPCIYRKKKKKKKPLISFSLLLMVHFIEAVSVLVRSQSVIVIIHLWPKGPLSLQHLPLFGSFSLIRCSALWRRVLTIALSCCKWWKAQLWGTGQGERIFWIPSMISQTWKQTDLYRCVTTGNIRPLSILYETSGKCVRGVNPSGSMDIHCKYSSTFF